jgi:hypothetical protein
MKLRSISANSEHGHEDRSGRVVSRERWFEHRQGGTLALKLVNEVEHVARRAPEAIELHDHQLVTLADEV